MTDGWRLDDKTRHYTGCGNIGIWVDYSSLWGGKRVIIGVLRWGWVEVILRVSLEVILRKLLRHLDSHPPGRGLSEGVVRGGSSGALSGAV